MKRTPLIVVIMLLIVVAGCGDGKDSTETVPAGTAAGGTAAGGATTKPGSATRPGKLPDACALVTRAEVAAAYESTVSEGTKSDESDNECVFELSGRSKAGEIGLFSEVSVKVDTRDADSAYDKVKVVFPNAVKVSLGDEAWSIDLIVYQLHIMKGAIELEISGPLLKDVAASKQAANDLGKVLVAKI